MRRPAPPVALECLEDRTLPSAVPLTVLADHPVALVSDLLAHRAAVVAANPTPPAAAAPTGQPTAGPGPGSPVASGLGAQNVAPTGQPTADTNSGGDSSSPIADSSGLAAAVVSATGGDTSPATGTSTGTTLATSTAPGSTVPGSTVPGSTLPTNTFLTSPTPTSTIPSNTGPGSTVPGSPTGTTPIQPPSSTTAAPNATSSSAQSPSTSSTAAATGVTSAAGGSATAVAASSESNGSGTNGSPGASNTQQPSVNADSGEGDGDPVLNAVLSRALPGLSSTLLTLELDRMDGSRSSQGTLGGGEFSFTADLIPVQVFVTGGPGGAGGVVNALFSDGSFGAPAQVLLTIEGALGLSFTGGTNTGAMRSQGIDFRPLNGSGVGVVGTVLVGVEVGAEEQQDPAGDRAAALPDGAKVAGRDPRDAPAVPAQDAALKQFLLGLEPSAVHDAPDDRTGPVDPPMPAAAVGPAPALVLPAGAPLAALDAACVEGFEGETAGDAPPEGVERWTGAMFLLVAPVLFLSWQPETSRKHRPGPVSTPPKL